MRRQIVRLLLCLTVSGCTHQRPAERWLLSYDGSLQHKLTEGDFYVRTLTGPETRRCAGGLFTGVIFLGLRESGSGRWFAAWMNSTRENDATLDDWFAYTDTLTALGGPLRRLDSAASRVGTGRMTVAVMIPARPCWYCV